MRSDLKDEQPMRGNLEEEQPIRYVLRLQSAGMSEAFYINHGVMQNILCSRYETRQDLET